MVSGLLFNLKIDMANGRGGVRVGAGRKSAAVENANAAIASDVYNLSLNIVKKALHDPTVSNEEKLKIAVAVVLRHASQTNGQTEIHTHITYIRQDVKGDYSLRPTALSAAD